MKKSELKQMIKEEMKKVLKEETKITTASGILFSACGKLLAAIKEEAPEALNDWRKIWRELDKKMEDLNKKYNLDI
jgi:hypothetical protein